MANLPAGIIKSESCIGWAACIHSLINPKEIGIITTRGITQNQAREPVPPGGIGVCDRLTHFAVLHRFGDSYSIPKTPGQLSYPIEFISKKLNIVRCTTI